MCWDRAGVPYARRRAAQAGRVLLAVVRSVGRGDGWRRAVDIPGAPPSSSSSMNHAPCSMCRTLYRAASRDLIRVSAQAFGSDFIHDGTGLAGAPPYVEPGELLDERTVDPMVPLMKPGTQVRSGVKNWTRACAGTTSNAGGIERLTDAGAGRRAGRGRGRGAN
jgi:hypothetical protein